jgi:thymidylate synthase (FAD)
VSIKVITEPKVYILASLTAKEYEGERFLADNGTPDWTTDTEYDADGIVEFCGRLCYDSFKKPRPGGNRAYIDHILEVGHGSVLEHAVWTLILTGISRSLSHELVRHRAGLSPSQLSQRYVDSSAVAFVLPPMYASLPGDHAAVNEWRCACDCALDSYRQLVEIAETLPAWKGIEDRTLRRKAAREAARSVLPNCTETKVALTGNARAWRWLLELRGSIHADAEFRRLAVAIYRALAPEAPGLFGDFALAERDGTEVLGCRHHKV